MAEKEMAVAFWLGPAAAAEELLRARIEELAERFHAPLFAPHVTLQAGPVSKARAREVLRQIADRPPLRLKIERIAFSQEFTKTLFVQFHAHAAAAQLSAEIAGLAGLTNDYRFDPHLSLIYGGIGAHEKEAVARALALPFTSVVFDSVHAIAIPSQIRRRADVEGWRTIGARKFPSRRRACGRA